jgi:hypothetical protein
VTPGEPHEGVSDPPPPFGGRWSVLYAIVLVTLAGVIAALVWLTRHYA